MSRAHARACCGPRKVRRAAPERYGADVGLLAKPTHGATIRLTPPLTISAQEVDTALAVLALALERVDAGDRGKGGV